MAEDEWAGWPPLGTRVRVPFGTMTLVGEITGRRRMWLSGEQVAQVRMPMPGTGPYDEDDVDEEREESEEDDEYRYEYDPYGMSRLQMMTVPIEREALDVIAE